MKKTTISMLIALATVTAACDDRKSKSVDAGDDNPMIDAPTAPKTYKQIEHLARPGIAEALLLSNAFLAGYNATAPTFAGVDPAVVGMVAGEAKTVLKAIYLGACLLNGVLNLTPATGVKPAGAQCVEVGGAIFVENNALTGVTLKPTVVAAADAYANRVFDQFVPDVMRIDLTVSTTTAGGILGTSSYESLCGNPAMPLPLLCGGRFLDDDTIDVTYDYLINGAGTPSGTLATFNQFSALVSDGVQFSATANKSNRTPPTASNEAQFHPAVTGTFPYSANPL